MKYIILLLLVLSFTSVSAAESIKYLRAVKLSIGTKTDAGVAWDEDRVVDILIKVTDGSLTVYSKRTQVYHTIAEVKSDSGFDVFRCKDEEGITCNVFTELKNNMVVVGVEYEDIIYFYICEFE